MSYIETANRTFKHICELERTIAELEKRIAAFEAHHEEKDALIIGLSRDAQRNAEDARAERQRREEAERALRPLDEAFASHGNAERDSLNKMRGCLGLWHFSNAAVYFTRFRHPDSAPPSSTEAENE